jgi:hypothetical protein
MNGSVARELPVASALLIRRELAQNRPVTTADTAVRHSARSPPSAGLPGAAESHRRLDEAPEQNSDQNHEPETQQVAIEPSVGAFTSAAHRAFVLPVTDERSTSGAWRGVVHSPTLNVEVSGLNGPLSAAPAAMLPTTGSLMICRSLMPYWSGRSSPKNSHTALSS